MAINWDILTGNTSEDTKDEEHPYTAFNRPTLDIVIDLPEDEQKLKEDITKEVSAAPEAKPFKQTELDTKKELLKSEGYTIPDIAKTPEEKTWLENRVDNLSDALYTFDRPSSASMATLIEGVKQAKEDIGTVGEAIQSNQIFTPDKRDFAEQVKTKLIRNGDLVSAYAKGMVAPREQQYTGRMLYNEIFGKENVDKFDKFFKDLGDSNFVQGGKLSDALNRNFKDSPVMKEVAKAITRTQPILTGMDMGKDAQKFAIKHIPDGIYLGTEMAVNPLTYIPFGAIPEVGKYVTSGVIKGSMAGLAKMSPELAQGIEHIAGKAANEVSHAFYSIYKNIYPKGAAKWAMKNLIGEEGAVNTIDGIHEAINSAAGQAEDIIKGLAEKVPVPTKVGYVRKGIGKVFEAMKIIPKNRMMKYLAGMEDGRALLTDTTNTLRTINDQISALTYGQTKEEAQNLIKGLLSGTATDEELHRVSRAFDLGSTFRAVKQTKEAVEEEISAGKKALGVSEKEKVNMESMFTPDIKGEVESGMSAAKGEARKIVNARRDFRLAQLEARYKATKDIIRKGIEEAKRLSKELKANVNWLTGETKIASEVELKRSMSKVRQDMKQSLEDLGRTRDRKIKELMTEKNPEQGSLKRERWFRERDKAISKVKIEYEKMRGAVVGNGKQRMVDIHNALQKKGEEFYAKNVSDLAEMFKNKTSEVQFGLPTPEGLKEMYETAKKQIMRQHAKEGKFFEQQMKKVKFIDAWNGMMIKNAKEFTAIADREIAKLPKEYQGLARAVSDVMDLVASMDQATGKLDNVAPGYFPRIAVQQKNWLGMSEGMNIFSREDFEKGLYRVMSNTGISKYTKERIMKYYADFAKAAEARGLKTVDDIFDIVYQRVLASNRAFAQKKALEMVPDVVKANVADPSDRNVKLIRHYLEFVYNGGSMVENAVQKAGGRLLNAYNLFNKTWLTTMSPVFHVTNAVSAPFMTGAKAGMDAFNPATYVEAAAIKTGVTKELIRKDGEKISRDAFMKAGKEFNALGSSYASKDIVKNVDQMLNRYSKADPRWWMMKSVAFGNEIEELNRTHAAYVFWKQGKSVKDSWRLSKATQFDYGDTNQILKAMNGLFAFQTWHFKNMSAQTKLIFNDPKQLALLSGIVRNLSSGNQLTSEQSNALNQLLHEPETLNVIVDGVKGMQDIYKFGMLPAQDNFKGIQKLMTGDIDGYLGDQAGLIKPALKPILARIGRYVEQRGTVDDQAYPKLNERMTYVMFAVPKSIEILNKVQKAVSGDPIKIEEVPVWDRGEQRMEKRIRVAPWMNELLNTLPITRQIGEAGKLIQISAKRNGLGPGPYTLGDLLAAGEFATPEDMLAFAFNVNKSEVDLDKAVELVKRKALKAVTQKLENVGMYYKTSFPTKETGKKEKAIKRKAIEERMGIQ